MIRQSAEITSIVNGSTTATIAPGSEPQAVTIRTGEKATVTFRFLYYAEYLLPGTTFLFREGQAKGIGRVTRITRRSEVMHL